MSDFKGETIFVKRKNMCDFLKNLLQNHFASFNQTCNWPKVFFRVKGFEREREREREREINVSTWTEKGIVCKFCKYI
mgnify:CR=1 FL=1